MIKTELRKIILLHPLQRGTKSAKRILSFPSWVGNRGGSKYVKTLPLILSLVLLFTAKSAYAQDSPFEQLKQKFENGQIFKADFTHTYVDSYTEDESQNSGAIWVGKKQYKVDSPNQLVAVNGEISRVYDSERNRVIVSTYVPEEDDFAPSRILNGIDSTYTIDQQEKDGDNHLITLSSDDPFALFQKVEITLNSNLIPLKIFVRDPADNLITTTFFGGSFISKRENIFELEYPADAEIIDMRN